MIAATRKWIQRNRTPLTLGIGLVGAGYLATQYVIGKINDARERMSSDRIAKENLRRRFEQNQEDCSFTVLALLPSATTNILEAMNTEQITYEIQQLKGPSKIGRPLGSAGTPSIPETGYTDDDGRSINSDVAARSIQALGVTSSTTEASILDPAQSQAPPKPRRTKRQLWNDLTISSITRSFTLVYTLALLTIFTRIQLNLLGRRSYLSSVIALATTPSHNGIMLEDNDDLSAANVYGGDLDTNHRYLAFSWWLLNRGWMSLQAKVESAVRETFGSLSPRECLTYEAFSQLALRVRKKVEGETLQQRRQAIWLPFLLPPRDMEDDMLAWTGVVDSGRASSPSSPRVRKLLDETADLIESPAFHHVLTLLLDAGFAVLVENKLAQVAFELPPPENAAAEAMQATRAVALPKILSVLTRQAHVIGSGGGGISGINSLPMMGQVPNEYLAAMEQVPDLSSFSAVVYSANWQSEIAADRDMIMAESVNQVPSTRASVIEITAPPRKNHEEKSYYAGFGGGEFEDAWVKAIENGES